MAGHAGNDRLARARGSRAVNLDDIVIEVTLHSMMTPEEKRAKSKAYNAARAREMVALREAGEAFIRGRLRPAIRRCLYSGRAHQSTSASDRYHDACRRVVASVELGTPYRVLAPGVAGRRVVTRED